MRIGVDIDGVLADSLPVWVNELNSFFNKNKRVEDIHLYDICETYKITEEALYKFLEHKGNYLMSAPPPVTDASYYLNRIKQNHEVFIVTARDNIYGQETIHWLKKHSFPYDKLFLLGSHEKKEVCLENGLRVLVEDTLEISLEVSAAGVPVLLMDAPYNQGKLPGLIYRKRSWAEIYSALLTEPIIVL